MKIRPVFCILATMLSAGCSDNKAPEGNKASTAKACTSGCLTWTIDNRNISQLAQLLKSECAKMGLAGKPEILETKKGKETTQVAAQCKAP
jgi:hypothetical protein